MKDYTTKYIKLDYTPEEEADIYEHPIIEFFADHENLGHNVEVSFYEWTVFGGCVFTGTIVKTAEKANEYFKELLDRGYYIEEYKAE